MSNEKQYLTLFCVCVFVLIKLETENGLLHFNFLFCIIKCKTKMEKTVHVVYTRTALTFVSSK